MIVIVDCGCGTVFFFSLVALLSLSHARGPSPLTEGSEEEEKKKGADRGQDRGGQEEGEKEEG